MKTRILFFTGWALGLLLAISCNREPVPPPEPVIERITVANLRQMFDNGAATIDTNLFIRGIITLTPELNNLPAFVAYLQDSTAGICLTVAGENTFAIDSEVKILIRGAAFTEFNGLLQLGDIDIAKQVTVVKLTAPTPVPVKATIQELLEGKHQAQYVEIENVQFKEPGNFSGTKTVTDCTSELEVYTRSNATFASKPLPQGNGTIRGVASAYTDIQLLLRDETDVTMAGNRCGQSGKVYLTEDFTTLVKYADVSTLSGWKTYAEAGAKTWYGNEVSPRKWVQATAYQSNQPSVITWMVSPDIDLAQGSKPSLSFDSANGYDNGATLGLFVSSNYSGSATPWTATWTPVSFTKPASSPSGYSQFVSSGNIDLSAYNGKKINIAWVYTGSDPSGTASDKTTTWEVDNVLILEK